MLVHNIRASEKSAYFVKETSPQHIRFEQPVSAVANWLIASPLDKSLFDFLEALSARPGTYQECLRLELIERAKHNLGIFFKSDTPSHTLSIACDRTSPATAFLVIENRVQKVIYKNGDKLLHFECESNDEEVLKDISCCKKELFLLYRQKIIKMSPEEPGSPKTITDLENVTTGSFSSDGEYIFGVKEIASGKYVVILFPAHCPTTHTILMEVPDKDSYCAVDRAKKVALVSDDNKIFIIKISGPEKPTTVSLPKSIQRVEVSDDGSHGVVADDQTLYIIDLGSGTILKKITIPGPWPMSALACSPCGRYIYYGTTRGIVCSYDLRKPRGIVSEYFHPSPICLIAAHGDGSKLYSACESQRSTLYLWHLRHNLPILMLIIKARQFSLDQVKHHNYFEKAYEALKNMPEDLEKPWALAAINAYQQCAICCATVTNCTMNCDHNLCKNCLENVLEKESSLCPFCRAPITSFSGPDGFHSIEYEATIE